MQAHATAAHAHVQSLVLHLGGSMVTSSFTSAEAAYSVALSSRRHVAELLSCEQALFVGSNLYPLLPSVLSNPGKEVCV